MADNWMTIDTYFRFLSAMSLNTLKMSLDYKKKCV